MSEINCSVISDLLPLYAENMVSPETRQMIAAHLGTCAECKNKYDEIIKKIPLPDEKNQQEAKPLKKFRFHLLMNILAFPIWLPFGIIALAVFLVLYISLWVVDISLWAIPLSFGAVFITGIIVAIIAFSQGAVSYALFVAGCSAVCLGLAVFSFYICLGISKAIVRLTVLMFRHKRKSNVNKEVKA